MKYRVEILNLPSCEVVRQFEEQTENIYMIAVSSDGKTIAGGGYEEVHIWDFRSGMKLWSFPTHPRVTTDVIFTPDGTGLITRSFGNMAVWSLEGDRLTSLGDVNIGESGDCAGGLTISCNGVIAITTS